MRSWHTRSSRHGVIPQINSNNLKGKHSSMLSMDGVEMKRTTGLTPSPRCLIYPILLVGEVYYHTGSRHSNGTILMQVHATRLSSWIRARTVSIVLQAHFQVFCLPRP